MELQYRLIALDVDGTLLNDEHEVTPRVREAVRAVAGQGAEIVICTGRGSTSALPVLRELGLKGTMITHNGASVVDSETRRVIHDTVISHEQASLYTEYCLERGIHFDMNTAFDLYVASIGEEAATMYRHLRARPILRGYEEGMPERLVKLSVFADKEVMDAIEKDWAGWEPVLQAIRSGDNFIDVQHPQASKGRALERLAAIRGISREQVMAIGNYYNDTGMLQFAGRGVAMDNSPSGVKAVADEIAASNNEDGVAVVLERLLAGIR